MSDQLGLFGRPRSPGDDAATRAIASRLPREVRFGTSSWSFPGWRGIVWPDEPGWTDARCARHGLEVYATHPLLRSVGIDRSFYGPLTAEELARFAKQLPDGFRAVSKVWEAITSTRAKAKAADERSHRFSVQTFVDEVITPHRRAFAAHTGPFVLEFPAGEALDVQTFAAELDAFLTEAAPAMLPFTAAVEVRDAALLEPVLGRVLARHAVPLCFTFHPTMPTLAEQMVWASRHGLFEGKAPLVARLMLPKGAAYEARRAAAAPFDRLLDVHDEMRRHVVDLVGRAVRAGRDVFVLVNNKAEGSAPLTIRALAEMLA